MLLAPRVQGQRFLGREESGGQGVLHVCWALGEGALRSGGSCWGSTSCIQFCLVLSLASLPSRVSQVLVPVGLRGCGERSL